MSANITLIFSTRVIKLQQVQLSQYSDYIRNWTRNRVRSQAKDFPLLRRVQTTS